MNQTNDKIPNIVLYATFSLLSSRFASTLFIQSRVASRSNDIYLKIIITREMITIRFSL